MGKRKAGSSILGPDTGVYTLPTTTTPGVAIVTTGIPGVFAQGATQVTSDSLSTVSAAVPNMPQTTLEGAHIVTTDTANTFAAVTAPDIAFTSTTGKGLQSTTVLGKYENYDLPILPLSPTAGKRLVTTGTAGTFGKEIPQTFQESALLNQAVTTTTTEGVFGLTSLPIFNANVTPNRAVVTTTVANAFSDAPLPVLPTPTLSGKGIKSDFTLGSLAWVEHDLVSSTDLPTFPVIGVTVPSGASFVYTQLSTNYTISITAGTYTPAELVTHLNSLLTGTTSGLSNLNELFTFNYDSSTQMLGLTQQVTASSPSGGVGSFPTSFGWTNTTTWTGFTANAQYWAGSKLGVVAGMNLVTTSTTGTFAAQDPPNTQVRSDWDASGTIDEILNKPVFPVTGVNSVVTGMNVRTTGTAGTFQGVAPVKSDWSASSGEGEILNKPVLPVTGVDSVVTGMNVRTTATAGTFQGVAPVKANWSASSGEGEILNKPVLPVTGVDSVVTGMNVRTTGTAGTFQGVAPVKANWSASSGEGEILNKPVFPLTSTTAGNVVTTSGVAGAFLEGGSLPVLPQTGVGGVVTGQALETTATAGEFAAYTKPILPMTVTTADRVLVTTATAGTFDEKEPGEPNWTFHSQTMTDLWTGTHTNPLIFGTTLEDHVYYRKLGPKTWRVHMAMQKNTNTGFVNRQPSEYLFTLPTIDGVALQFNTTPIFQVANTAAANASNAWVNHGFPAKGNLYSGAGATLATVFVRILPWNATQFRIVTALFNSTVNVVNGQWFHYTLGPNMRYELDFEFESSN